MYSTSMCSVSECIAKLFHIDAVKDFRCYNATDTIATTVVISFLCLYRLSLTQFSVFFSCHTIHRVQTNILTQDYCIKILESVNLCKTQSSIQTFCSNKEAYIRWHNSIKLAMRYSLATLIQ